MADLTQNLKLKITQDVNSNPLKEYQAELRKAGIEQTRLAVSGKQNSQAFQDNSKYIQQVKRELLDLKGVMAGFQGKKPLSIFQILETGENITTIARGFKAAVSDMTHTVTGFINEANKLQSATLGLEGVAKFKGIDKQAAVDAVQNLQIVKDGLITVGDASLALKNLLASGFGLEESIDLVKGFGDSAAFGRQSALEFGYAITSATEGIKNQNSILVDNAGVTKNLSIILKEAGFSEKDLQNVMSDASVRQALYNGILKETAAFTGDAARLTHTFQGQQQKLNAQITVLKQNFGIFVQNALTPYLQKITESNESTKTFAGGVITAGGALASLIPIIANIRLATQGLNFSLAGLGKTLGVIGLVIAALETANLLSDKLNDNAKTIDKAPPGTSDTLPGKDGSLDNYFKSGKQRGEVLDKIKTKTDDVTSSTQKLDDKLKNLGGKSGKTGSLGGTTTKEVEVTNELIDAQKDLNDLLLKENTFTADQKGQLAYIKYLQQVAELKSHIAGLQLPSDLLKVTSGIGDVTPEERARVKRGVDPDGTITQGESVSEQAEKLFNKINDSSNAITSIMSTLGIGTDNFVSKLLSGFNDTLSIVNSIVSLLSSISGGGSGFSLLGTLLGFIPGGGAIAAAGGASGGLPSNNLPSSRALRQFNNSGNSSGATTKEVPYILTTDIKADKLRVLLKRADKDFNRRNT